MRLFVCVRFSRERPPGVYEMGMRGGGSGSCACVTHRFSLLQDHLIGLWSDYPLVLDITIFFADGCGLWDEFQSVRKKPSNDVPISLNP